MFMISQCEHKTILKIKCIKYIILNASISIDIHFKFFKHNFISYSINLAMLYRRENI